MDEEKWGENSSVMLGRKACALACWRTLPRLLRINGYVPTELFTVPRQKKHRNSPFLYVELEMSELLMAEVRQRLHNALLRSKGVLKLTTPRTQIDIESFKSFLGCIR